MCTSHHVCVVHNERLVNINMYLALAASFGERWGCACKYYISDTHFIIYFVQIYLSYIKESVLVRVSIAVKRHHDHGNS